MNSPPDPDTPISTDTESTPPEDVNPPLSPHQGFTNIASQLTQSLVSGSGSSKRRLPSGGQGVGASSSTRDPKTRRRNDSSKAGGMGGAPWENISKDSKREERDLVDHNVVDFLRKEVGDPFLESVIQKHS